MKTVRFSQVVKLCGRPEVHNQWVPLKEDRHLKQAIKAGKVMTVHVETVGTRKDHGKIGYQEGDQRQVLIFPESLDEFRERKVVGIDYGLLAKDPAPSEKEEPAREIRSQKAKCRKGTAGHKLQDPFRLKRPADETLQKSKAASPMEKTPNIKDATVPQQELILHMKTAIEKALQLLQDGKVVKAYRQLEDCLKNDK